MIQSSLAFQRKGVYLPGSLGLNLGILDHPFNVTLQKTWLPDLSGRPFHQSMRADLVEKAALVVQENATLINMVSKRVKQLTQGRPALVERKPGMREADIALTEIIEGKIKVERIEDVEAL